MQSVLSTTGPSSRLNDFKLLTSCCLHIMFFVMFIRFCNICSVFLLLIILLFVPVVLLHMHLRCCFLCCYITFAVYA